MLAKRLLSRVILALGVTTLIATSPPPTWRAEASEDILIESEGAGDDQLIRVRLTISGNLRREIRGAEVNLDGTVSRPASDLLISWTSPEQADAPSFPGEGRLVLATGDFTTAVSYRYESVRCSRAEFCELLWEARVSAEAPDSYALEGVVRATIHGDGAKRPAGDLELSVEVLPAPPAEPSTTAP